MLRTLGGLKVKWVLGRPVLRKLSSSAMRALASLMASSAVGRPGARNGGGRPKGPKHRPKAEAGQTRSLGRKANELGFCADATSRQDGSRNPCDLSRAAGIFIVFPVIAILSVLLSPEIFVLINRVLAVDSSCDTGGAEGFVAVHKSKSGRVSQAIGERIEP
jgi:hypothetical protein